MHARIALLGAALVGIVGCRETRHCDPNQSFQNGECVSLGDGGGAPDTGLDAARAPDTGADGGSDAGFDGGPCDPSVCGSGHVCTTTADASTDVGLSCVECVTDEQCAPVDGGIADAGAHIDGGHIPGHVICEDFHCRPGCRSDGDCASGVCRPNQTCSAYLMGGVAGAAAPACAPCDTTRNCLTGLLDCVETFYGIPPVSDGYHCIPNPTTGFPCGQPFTNVITAAPIEGGPAVPYCSISVTTTCAAVRATMNRVHCTSVSTDSVECAEQGAQCQVLPSLGAVCTYGCTSDDQCPTTMACLPEHYCH